MINKINKIILIIFLFTGLAKAQTYELLNERLNNDDTIYIKYKFDALDNDIITKYITKNFVINSWEPLPISNVPDINLFLNNFNLENAKKKAILNNESDSLIDFSQLNNNVVKINETDKHLKSGNNYLVLTKPIFNCDKTWAISYIYGVYHFDVGSSGDLVIFRKIKGKWTRFHHLTMWIS